MGSIIKIMPRRAEPEGIRQALKGGASVRWLALCGPASCSNLYLIKYYGSELRQRRSRHGLCDRWTIPLVLDITKMFVV